MSDNLRPYEAGSMKPATRKGATPDGPKLPKRPKRDTGARYVDRKPKDDTDVLET